MKPEEAFIHFGWEEITGDPMSKITLKEVQNQIREMGL